MRNEILETEKGKKILQPFAYQVFKTVRKRVV